MLHGATDPEHLHFADKAAALKGVLAGNLIACDGDCMRSFCIGRDCEGVFRDDNCNPLGMPEDLGVMVEVRTPLPPSNLRELDTSYSDFFLLSGVPGMMKSDSCGKHAEVACSLGSKLTCFKPLLC